MYIFKLNPVFKDYIWGGTKLRDEYGFESNLDKLAEGWMLSCHKDGENTILNGDFQGKTITEVVKEKPDFLGENGKKFEMIAHDISKENKYVKSVKFNGKEYKADTLSHSDILKGGKIEFFMGKK